MRETWRKTHGLYIYILTNINITIIILYMKTLLEYRQDVKKLKALADENRLAVMELLLDGEKCACVLLEKMNITQPTLSHHMKILCDAGLVDYRKAGKWMHYSISKEGSRELRSLIGQYTVDDDSELKSEDSDCCR